MSTLQRTYSSPSLKGNRYGRGHTSSRWESQQEKYGYDLEDSQDEEFYIIGDRVYVDGFRPASVAYFGEVQFAGGDWVGVVLDDPTGNHEGKVHGREYFQCAPMHGLFVKPRRVNRMPDSALRSSATSSRASTPFIRRSCTSSRSPGSSLMDSYYYDHDYRPEPTVASLTRRLHSIHDHDRYRHQHHDDESSTAYRRPSSRQSSSMTPTSMTTTRAGILKGASPRSHSTEPLSISDRTSELARRINQATQDSLSRSPVFNFRPRRAKLDEYERLRATSSSASTSPISGSPMHLRYRTTEGSGGGVSLDLSSEPPKKGDRVIVRSDRGEMTGILRYVGETNFATGEWAGVELDHPGGKNDGSVLNYRYFHCPQNYGLFVPAIRVKKCPPRSLNSIRSTLKSPPPLVGAYACSRSVTPSGSSSYSSLACSSGKGTHTPDSSLLSPTKSSDRLNRLTLSSSSSLFNDDSTPLRENSNLLNSSSLFGSSPARDSSSSPLFGDRKSRFDDKDIDFQLRKSLQKTSSGYHKSPEMVVRFDQARPKSIKYTFSSSKYDGNPIARRTFEYD